MRTNVALLGDHVTLTIGGALRELRTAQKSAKGVSLYSRHINRPAGRVLAAGAYRARLTPNQVTLVSAAFSLGAVLALALARPSWPLALAVYLGLVVGFAFDSADGQLARLLGRGSPAGEWLDHVVDAGKITAIHAAVLISFHRFFDLPSEGWLLLPLGFQFVAVMIFSGGLLADKLKPKPPRPRRRARPPRRHGCAPSRCCPSTTGCSAWSSSPSGRRGSSSPRTPRCSPCTRSSSSPSSRNGSAN